MQWYDHFCCCCLQAGRRFCSQQPLYASSTELSAHIAAEHPSCQDCGSSFYDAEELQQHTLLTDIGEEPVLTVVIRLGGSGSAG